MKTLKMLLLGSAIIMVAVACSTVQINTGSNAATQMPAQPTQAPEQPAEPAPGGWRDDIPFPSGVINFVSTTDKVTCNTTNDLETTHDFYTTEMPKYGWSLDSETTSPIAVNLYFSKGDEVAHIGLTISADGALIMIIVGPQSPDESVKATTEPVEPTTQSSEPTTAPTEPTTEPVEPTAEPTEAPESPPAPGGWRDDVPIPSDANNLVRTSQEITFDTGSDLRATADFYKTEMPKYGWTLTSETTTSIAIDLIFAKGGEEAVVGLVLSPLMMAGTRVGIVID
jgi:hypothetical protein